MYSRIKKDPEQSYVEIDVPMAPPAGSMEVRGLFRIVRVLLLEYLGPFPVRH